MKNLRFVALQSAQNRQWEPHKLLSKKISEYFGVNVFGDTAMQEYLSEEAYEKVKAAIESKDKIDSSIAEQAASAMKAWAMAKGATHFSHWFQPLTGQTAEKHDAFFTVRKGKAIEEFKGNALLQQGPDASDFPTGGLRSTFEARGYTAWDPSSPAFIMVIGEGRTLCIPTIFVSYNGEALDYKSPLLKSQQFLETAAVPVANYFDRFVTKVFPMLGVEQEYYAVDEAFVNTRPDLLLANRTLVGAPTPKVQELQNHYFGAIPERIYAFMMELEEECHKLGIPVVTRHNEVGPAQFEIVPEFEEVNVSIDHNLLLMDLMHRVAKRHKLRILLHEKPFAKNNGSAKHNNWSLHTDTGKNLFSPADTPRKNLLFLTFFINTLKAINDNDDILRACIASSGNDLRIGTGGAPPALISVFIGKQMRELLEDMEKKGDEWFENEDRKTELKMEIHNRIPDLMKENTDENRTSPIAFTGGKFELRQVGAGHNSSSPMIVMNTIVGKQLQSFKTSVDDLVKKKGFKKDAAILKVLQNIIPGIKNLLFEGDNNSELWHKEMKTRKRSAAKSTPEALDAYTSDKAKKLFSSAGVLSENELEARRENLLNRYSSEVETEAKVLLNICINHILPSGMAYLSKVADNINAISAAGIQKSRFVAQQNLMISINDHYEKLSNKLESLAKLLSKAESIGNTKAKADNFCNEIRPFLEEIREHADELELNIDDKLWPLPKYTEMLYIH
ncbi:MAG: glutamine synthetase III [Bacteroidota bacterium]